jgi:NADH-quinone oxidoreductase subunit L
MASSENWFQLLGILVVASPAMLVVLMGLKALLGLSLRERTLHYWTAATTTIGLLAALAILGGMLKNGIHLIPIEMGNWVVIPEQHFHFHLKFVFDRLSIPFCILSFILCGIVSAFSHRYLHREPGYGRFFVN